MTLEHLLLALAEDPEASVVLKSSNVDIDRLTAEVTSRALPVAPRRSACGGTELCLSADLRRILEAPPPPRQQGRRREINGAIVLAAIVGDGKSTAAHFLREQGLTFEEAIRALQRHGSAAAASRTPAPSRAHPPPHASACCRARRRRSGFTATRSAARRAERRPQPRRRAPR